MEMKIKKWLSIFIVLILCLSLTGSWTGNAKKKITLEVAVFQGGFGLDFFKKVAREYEKLHPEVKINLWGNPRIWEQLRPRFVAGTPPDLSWPGWGMDVWSLVYEGQVYPMNKFLETKAYDQNKKWKDTFMKSLLEKGKYKGKYYIMPYNYNAYGWWYNVDMFKKNGWKPPKTWKELLSLCEKIKKKGIAPITFQGRYPYYMVNGFLIPWAISIGGMQAFEDAENLVPGAWKSQAFLKAAEMVRLLSDRGYFQKGAMGMTHTEAQMEFIKGRAAMVPCGTWLHSEMEAVIPKGFHMEFFLPPIVEGGKGDPSFAYAGPETWIIPKKAKHPEIAADLYKYMTSLKVAKRFVVEKGSLMSIIDSDKVKLPPHLVTAAKVIRKAKKTWYPDCTEWYPTLGKVIQDGMAALINKEITPAEYVEKIEKEAARIRKDKKIVKHKVKL